MERLLFKEQYRLSSLSLSHTGYLLATMDSGPNGDSFLAPRMLPDPDEGGDYRWPPFFSHPIRIHTTSSLWCSAPSPTSDIPRFAVGTSDGLYTLEGFGSYWTLSKKPFPNDKSSGNPKKRRTDSSHALITAVEWLSSDVIAAGLKDSTIFLHDVRSGGSATRLQHPHAVTKIRKLDPYRIVVAGINSVCMHPSLYPIIRLSYDPYLQYSIFAAYFYPCRLTRLTSQLQMYDIRYPPNNLQRSPNPNKSHHTSTRPYLTFSTNYPEINITPDFDISPELGLLASASPTDRDSTVQLYSLRTGEQVASPLTRYRYRDSIRSVCFESGNQSAAHGSQTPSLLVCSEATVDEWKW
jgi:WD40 repeat protein